METSPCLYLSNFRIEKRHRTKSSGKMFLIIFQTKVKMQVERKYYYISSRCGIKIYKQSITCVVFLSKI